MFKGMIKRTTIASTWKGGWREIGGKRKYFRSKWEINYCHYLEFLKQKNYIKDWLHEPDTFWFEGIKRGVRSYLPDFKVIHLDDSIEYHEVKGYTSPRNQTALKRLNKYHPTIKLILIKKKQYTEIKNKCAKFIRGWES